MNNSTSVEENWFNQNDPQKIASIKLAILVSSSLSLLASIALISSYLFFKSFRTPMNSLVIWLAVSDFISAAGFLLGELTMDSMGWCTFNGVLLHFALVSSILWNACMATHAVYCIKSQKPVSTSIKYVRRYHMVVCKFSFRRGST